MPSVGHMPEGVYRQETSSPTEFHTHPIELRNRTQAHGDGRSTLELFGLCNLPKETECGPPEQPLRAGELYLGLPRAREEVDPFPEWLIFRLELSR